MSYQGFWENSLWRNISPSLRSRRWTWRRFWLWLTETWKSWELKQTGHGSRYSQPYLSWTLGKGGKDRFYKRPSITSSRRLAAVPVTLDRRGIHALRQAGVVISCSRPADDNEAEVCVWGASGVTASACIRGRHSITGLCEKSQGTSGHQSSEIWVMNDWTVCISASYMSVHQSTGAEWSFIQCLCLWTYELLQTDEEARGYLSACLNTVIV